MAFRGRRTCICVATSLPVVEQALLARGLIRHNIDIFQQGYNAGGVAASAGTHDRGGCTDVGQFTDDQLAVWRALGWTQQHRSTAQGFSGDHGHGWPKGCPHLSRGARFQASEWEAGRNGLRSAGPITGPGPKGAKTPTWQAALRRLAPLAAASEKEIDMAEWRRYVRNADQKLSAAGKYQYLKINDKGDVSFATGPCKIIGLTLALKITNLAPGKKLLVRFVEDDVSPASTIRSFNADIHQVVGAGGATYAVIPWARKPGKADHGSRRCRVIVAGPKGTVVDTASIAYWRAAA